MTHPRSGPLLAGQLHCGESLETEHRETFMLSGGDFLRQGKAATIDERCKIRTTREKAVSWLLTRLGFRGKKTRADGIKEAKFKWQDRLKWKEGENSRNTNARIGDTSDKEDKRDRLSAVSCSNEMLEEFDREAYIGRRTSIGSVERDDAMILFGILDGLKDFKDPTKTRVNLRRLQRHILARCGDTR